MSDTRSEMNALYQRLRKNTSVPRWVVKAYVVATFGRADVERAASVAHFGVGLDGLGPGGRDAVAGWIKAMQRASAT